MKKNEFFILIMVAFVSLVTFSNAEAREIHDFTCRGYLSPVFKAESEIVSNLAYRILIDEEHSVAEVRTLDLNIETSKEQGLCSSTEVKVDNNFGALKSKQWIFNCHSQSEPKPYMVIANLTPPDNSQQLLTITTPQGQTWWLDCKYFPRQVR